MRVLPILFNAEMVRAILGGRKTVTRRLVKPRPMVRLGYIAAGNNCGKWGYPSDGAREAWGDEFAYSSDLLAEEKARLWTPPCHADDVLYVRETFAPLHKNDASGEIVGYIYAADADCVTMEDYDRKYPGGTEWTWEGRWRPSIHMPKEAARLWLRVTGVMVERLHDMTDAEISQEGVSPSLPPELRRKQFGALWDSTIRRADIGRYGWQANPWVWRVEFEWCEKPATA